MTHRRERTLAAAGLARVEGEGALRSYREPPDITSRVCGICPVAYQTSAFLAIGAACGVHVDGPIADLRRLLYCGEWIASHALHIYLLHAPDFLGYPGAIEMARDHREIVERGSGCGGLATRLCRPSAAARYIR
jgi:sulfhydrogenase subunit alpha